MSTPNIVHFQELVATHPQWKERIEAILQQDGPQIVEEVVALANEAGIPLTAQELLAFQAQSDPQAGSAPVG